ncbi:MAG: type II toxin-antitoxin system RatA family toxin [Alphaproteobacteria bacterium]|nr:type II toxin-antitoxin system RatA family toxin [Alphaproteobacteria bacterium]
MPTHAEVKSLPHTPEQLFDLVADVERYHEFLPWCISCNIIERADKNLFYADLVIGYKMFRERFRSKVTLTPKKEIRVEYLSGPLKHLSNIWRFDKNKDGTCTIDFYVDFEFKNPVFQKLMGVFFQEIIRRMVSAFEARADRLYGRSDKIA